jgi:hypothetical protein
MLSGLEGYFSSGLQDLTGSGLTRLQLADLLLGENRDSAYFNNYIKGNLIYGRI